MSKHTPGPWIVGHVSRDVVKLDHDTKKAIKIAQISNENNAKLIVAAPDLAEALDGLLDLALAHLNPSCPEIIKARAALAKAGL